VMKVEAAAKASVMAAGSYSEGEGRERGGAAAEWTCGAEGGFYRGGGEGRSWVAELGQHAVNGGRASGVHEKGGSRRTASVRAERATG
jgi:hypothetical protein